MSLEFICWYHLFRKGNKVTKNALNLKNKLINIIFKDTLFHNLPDSAHANDVVHVFLNIEVLQDVQLHP